MGDGAKPGTTIGPLINAAAVDKVESLVRDALARGASALLVAALDDTLPDAVVRIAAAHASVATLGPMFGPVTLERA